MLKVEKIIFSDSMTEAAFRGMRNPLDSWDKSDSYWYPDPHRFILGNEDHILAENLIKAGPDHSKFMRMIPVTADITGPLYWWKEMDTYKVGTVADSCSTMHTITKKKFTLDMFSTEHLDKFALANFENIILHLNFSRNLYNTCTDPDAKKAAWWNIIQLLPSSFNQKRTVFMNYAVLRNIYHARQNHKLDEWHQFIDDLILRLPYNKLITM